MNEIERRAIWVFGSNLAGRHAGGAARVAAMEYGAIEGVGVGRTGNAYAIPTLDARGMVLPLAAVEQHIGEFLSYARAHPHDVFLVTRIGCGIAGFRDEEIVGFFASAPANCSLAETWNGLLNRSIALI